MAYTQRTYLGVALDPIHAGTGGQRLGRVDLTVAREAVTRVPVLPGTGISGAMKFFADLRLRDQNWKTGICASTQGSAHGHDHEKCPICCAFGYTPQEEGAGESAQGTLQFNDGILLAYPVSTLAGPVWITTTARLRDCLGIGDGADIPDETYQALPNTNITTNVLQNRLNFGWVLLDRGPDSAVTVGELEQAGIEARYAKRMVLVSEWLFSQLVNNNLEVRTSVVIDPETGAAKKTGLFTYEAVSRGAIFCFDILEHDYYHAWQGVHWLNGGGEPSALDMMENRAFPGVAAIGMGGMTTRGFGRLFIKRATAQGGA